MRYAAVGFPMPNDIVFRDGRTIKGVMGGGSFYAYSGLKICSDDSIFLAATGDDFEQYFGEWFDRNGCTRDGLMLRTDRCVYYEVRYRPDGGYDEKSIYTESYDATTKAEQFIVASHLEKYFARGIKGVYLIGNHMDSLYCRTMMRFRDDYGTRIGWEFPPDYQITGPDDPDIRRILGICDYFSLNRKEASLYFGTSTDDESIDAIRRLGIPCYYRVGTDGAYFIDGGRAVKCPMISIRGREADIDPTGCGNVSTAAAMWAYFEGWSPERICTWAGILAGFNALQYGPCPDAGEKTRSEALRLLEELAPEK
jgi:sugar/nucleoside kinase (ribokinase family)